MGVHTNFPAYIQPTLAAQAKTQRVRIGFAIGGLIGAVALLVYPLFIGGSDSILLHYASVAMVTGAVIMLVVLRSRLAEIKTDQAAVNAATD